MYENKAYYWQCYKTLCINNNVLTVLYFPKNAGQFIWQRRRNSFDQFRNIFEKFLNPLLSVRLNLITQFNLIGTF